jgi:hypothetical protein
MATLVLTTVGSIVGGPIGGAIGAVIGQTIDQRILSPKGRRGPRLGDLSVQTSSYGSAIPKLFGKMRVAGTVIWATDLAEARQSGSGGKGQPAGTTYSYSASFAVVLSGRPIRTIHRIWADGKLLRGAGGDWKTRTQFRFYRGGEDQDVDPLIASAEGVGSSPAYRGLAYAVFENLQLADFGNRIPSLTFEVEADSDIVPVGNIVEALSGGTVLAGSGGGAVVGYAASGDSVRGAAEVLAGIGGMSISDDGRTLRLGGAGSDVFVPDRNDLDAFANAGDAVPMQLERAAAGTLPDEVAISYYEPARDYQTGLQRARRGGPGRRVDSVDLAAALDADAAKAAAERRLAEAWAARVHAALALPPRALGIHAGARLRLPSGGATFRVAGWTLEHMVLKLQLSGTVAGAAWTPRADPGRPNSQLDEAAGPTRLELLDLPAIDDGATTPRLWIAAGGEGRGWRKAQLLASLDGGISYQPIGATAQKAVIGAALGVLPAGDAALFDDRFTIDVELADHAMWLESRSDDALVSGENAAMIGEELIQFGRAQPIGAGRFRLGRLLRGRRGSEASMASHRAGERFVLLDPATLKPLDAPAGAIGMLVRVSGIGIGDAGAAEASATLTGRALRPPSPVHLRAERAADGTIRIRWTRRSRVGWAWLDGNDAPLGEEVEGYRLTITPEGGAERIMEVPTAWFDYSPAAQADDGAAGTIEFAVVQVGAVISSEPSAPLQFSI